MPLHRQRYGDAGISLLEVLVTGLIFAVLVAIAIPVVSAGMQQASINSAVRNVAAEIRNARYAAVAKNRTLVLRFNCPGAGQFRLVEFTGDPTIDAAADRCSATSFPFPDPTPGTLPDADGAVMRLDSGIAFGTVGNLTFDPTGRIPAQTSIEVTNGSQTRTITVAPGGRVTE